MNSDTAYAIHSSRSFLGVDIAVLEAFMGIPTISFMYKGNEVYVYEDADLNTFEIRNGVVIKSNAVPDRRKAFRARPVVQVKAKIRTQEGEITGHLKDISIAGAAVTVSDAHGTRSACGTTAFLKCSLPLPEEKSPHDFVLKGTVSHVTTQHATEKIILLFSRQHNSPEYQRLSRYIMLRQVEMFLKSSGTWGGPLPDGTRQLFP